MTSSRPSFGDSLLLTSPAYPGAAFGTADDGDLFGDEHARTVAAGAVGITSDWAWMHQVHAAELLVVDEPGPGGTGDALLTRTPSLPLAVRTADCVPVVLHGRAVVAIVHAGWRGLAAGVMETAVSAMDGDVERAAIGPAIGPCCYEVGTDVLDEFPGFESKTTWGTPSLDLWSLAEERIGRHGAVSVWRADLCTHCEAAFHSYRATGTADRQISVAWL